MALWGYSELDALTEIHPNIKNGILIDTNIFVAATYERSPPLKINLS